VRSPQQLESSATGLGMYRRSLRPRAERAREVLEGRKEGVEAKEDKSFPERRNGEREVNPQCVPFSLRVYTRPIAGCLPHFLPIHYAPCKHFLSKAADQSSIMCQVGRGCLDPLPVVSQYRQSRQSRRFGRLSLVVIQECHSTASASEKMSGQTRSNDCCLVP
jgi:hypothetical protein